MSALFEKAQQKTGNSQYCKHNEKDLAYFNSAGSDAAEANRAAIKAMTKIQRHSAACGDSWGEERLDRSDDHASLDVRCIHGDRRPGCNRVSRESALK